MSSTAPPAPTPVAPIAPRRPPRRFSRRRFARRLAVNTLGLLVFAVMLFPVYWMVSTAFKPGVDILSDTPQWVPVHPTLSNFGDAIHRDFFWSSVLNSLTVVGAVVTFSLVLAFLAAVALAKFHFYGRKAFIVLIIGVQMVPLNALIIPLYLELSKAHQVEILGIQVGVPILVDKLNGLIVTYLALVIPFTVWTLRGFIHGVPKELEEAAMVDGSTRFGAFMRILVPLVWPGLVATSLFAFIQAWNEYIFAFVLLSSPEKQTVTLWLAGFITARGTAFGALMAGATLTALPVVIFFLLIHRKIAFGLTAGAVRG